MSRRVFEALVKNRPFFLNNALSLTDACIGILKPSSVCVFGCSQIASSWVLPVSNIKTSKDVSPVMIETVVVPQEIHANYANAARSLYGDKPWCSSGINFQIK